MEGTQLVKHTKKWTTKEGVKIRVCDMTDSHLEHTIKHLDKVAVWEEDNAIAAACAGDDIFNALEDVTEDLYMHPPIYWDMLEELSLRRRTADHMAHCEQIAKDSARARRKR